MAAEKVLVSACLLGERVRYDGGSFTSESAILARWMAEGRVVPVCPEVAGGLPVPRPPAEVQADGRIRTIEGVDVTAAFEAGAQEAVCLARLHGIRVAVLKESSPSCGSRKVYDGSFQGRRIPGEGCTVRALRALGVAVFPEQDWEGADRLLRGGEADPPTQG